MGRRTDWFQKGKGARVVRLAAFAALGLGLLLYFGWGRVRKAVRRPQKAPEDSSLVLVTGYCNCEKCCGWERDWFGLGDPVYASGPLKGKPKKVGVTASGTVATNGTIAADTRIWKYGTRLVVPGYGTGRVEDIGGAIKGRHIDIWFPTHAQARKWGAKWLKVVPAMAQEDLKKKNGGKQ